MGKVYFDKEKYGIWVVDDLEDYYSFKAVNFETNEESNHILSWSRNYDLKDHDSKIDRVYDVEIDREKYYFLFVNNGDGWDVISEDSMKLEKLLRETNLFFTGDSKIVE
jgi:hypothetical protein